MTATGIYNRDYLLDSDVEPLRLERQARIYGFEDDLRFLSLGAADQVLDAGCGSGAYTRAIAGAVPNGGATGVDRSAPYIDFARRAAAGEGVANARFEVGDVTALPFADGAFDVVWSKHLLQWVKDRGRALAEFRRVCRPGGRVVACNFDHFGVVQYPEDPQFTADMERWFSAAQAEMGFDNRMGRKLPHLFAQAGLTDLRVTFIPDASFSGLGGDPEKRWNWETQFTSLLGFSARVFGSHEAAVAFRDRLVERFSRPDVYSYCALFYVEGRVP
ncbi:MAG: methyltransferase domain-containing protein [Betaproteobacteria bacterium]|jgi:SAM-dependent methyltransferase|nr:methyltransferase domain-containing protein [Rhodocyclaceae bacterium]MCA3133729.1 methyltransferase domain-containing protein [Rhodocyclaceae bacterium]MCA3143050.1 methyltransferase domain-containing protein [Rhodocyclaceae bacterium]MCA3144157.1 methyltransferase domain-containing protein [Rhodocyclaceae bacterium]MCE2898201.1 methyltransferase domain-containing protein [Betaproteobacteria bacterium]